MLKSTIIFLVIALVFTTQPFLALAGIPDMNQCSVSMAYSGPLSISLLVVPDGDGNPFTEAHDPEGSVADATITLYIRDSGGVPVVNFPHEDCWLESNDYGMVPCIGGTVADQATDFYGMTFWANPLFAGGHSQEQTVVLINGERVLETLGLVYNSPDINGDLVVNLTDVATFSGAYFSDYEFYGDFNGDGVINLTDVSIFALHIGASCP